MKRIKLSTLLDVLAAVGIAAGAGVVVSQFLGLLVGLGVALFVLGVLRAAVAVWNAKS